MEGNEQPNNQISEYMYYDKFNVSPQDPVNTFDPVEGRPFLLNVHILLGTLTLGLDNSTTLE